MREKVILIIKITKIRMELEGKLINFGGRGSFYSRKNAGSAVNRDISDRNAPH